MPRRKRHDPDDAPIDGDLRFDTVFNKDPSKAYAGVSKEDMPRLIQRGYTRTMASEDGPRVPFGTPSEDGSEIVINGQLVLMEAPKELAERAQRAGEIEFARRTKGLHQSIRDHIDANPGVPGGHQFKVNSNFRAEG